ncbi:hypothetical protein ACFO9Q_12915 [Paenibacillus sp. GCM10023252]|uniref:hypothetical protein n=1 Tax=Paenibacillus sp. GCM10023252 TaxID=3252649 RepID=UPI0036230E19
MSRTWERKVRRNSTQLSKQRKKHGGSPIVASSEKVDRFKGRNYVIPAFIILFIGLYVILNLSTSTTQSTEQDTMFWVTIGLYVMLAVIFFFRRPYLAVGKDYVQTRRLTGDKRLPAASIKGFTLQQGYVSIEQEKGGNWVFSRFINRYPTDEMAVKLREFAKQHSITVQEK